MVERARDACARPHALHYHALREAGVVECLRKDQELEQIVSAIRRAGDSRP